MTRAPPHTQSHRRLLDRTRRAVRIHGLWSPGARILVACSGGSDSTALLHLLAELSPSLGHELVVGHVDHGLRAASANEAEHVQALAHRLGCHAEVERVDVAPGGALQARARSARHAALEAMRARHDCAVIATAHTADDVAETVLMRLTRGAGASGLGGIRWRRDRFVRPLLEASRASLQAWLRTAGIEWLEDPSNDDLTKTRARFRANVLPVLEATQPGAALAIARSAQNLATLGDALAWSMAAWLTIHARGNGDTLHIERARWPEDRAASSALLQAVAERVGAPAPSHAAIAQFHAWLARPAGRATPCEVAGIVVDEAAEALRFRARLVAPPRGAD